MKKFICAALISTVAANAHAAVTVDFRSDFKNVGEYKNVSNTFKDSVNDLTVSRARMVFAGNINDAVSYKLRLNFAKAVTTVYSDSTTDLFNYGYIQHKTSDNFAVLMGKLNLSTDGIEGDYNGGDVYFSTLAGGSQGQQFTGAAFDYMPAAGQKVEFVALENKGSSASATSQKHPALGVIYKGEMLDKSLTVIANYIQNYTQLLNDERSITWMGAGFKYKFSPAFALDFDYFQNTYAFGGQGATATSQKDKVETSMAVNLRYTQDNWTGIFKAEQSTSDDKGTSVTAANAFDRSRMGVAVEFRPNPSENFRYHVSYDAQTDKSKSATATTDGVSSTILVGMRFLTDVVK